MFSRVRDGLNVYFYVFSVFAFTALVDLLLGFGIAGKLLPGVGHADPQGHDRVLAAELIRGDHIAPVMFEG